MSPVVEPSDILTGFKDISIDAIVLDGATGSLLRHLALDDGDSSVIVKPGDASRDFTLYFPKKHYDLLRMYYEDGSVFSFTASTDKQKLSSDNATIVEFPPGTFFNESAEPLCRLTLEEYTLEDV